MRIHLIFKSYRLYKKIKKQDKWQYLQKLMFLWFLQLSVNAFANQQNARPFIGRGIFNFINHDMLTRTPTFSLNKCILLAFYLRIWDIGTCSTIWIIISVFSPCEHKMYDECISMYQDSVARSKVVNFN